MAVSIKPGIMVQLNKSVKGGDIFPMIKARTEELEKLVELKKTNADKSADKAKLKDLQRMLGLNKFILKKIEDKK